MSQVGYPRKKLETSKYSTSGNMNLLNWDIFFFLSFMWAPNENPTQIISYIISPKTNKQTTAPHKIKIALQKYHSTLRLETKNGKLETAYSKKPNALD